MTARHGDRDGESALFSLASPAVNGRAPRALLVEDEALIALNAEAILEEAGFAITGVAASYLDACALSDALPPDLAVIDVNLLDGRTGLRIAEHVHRTHGAMVVIATGNPEGIEAGGCVHAVLRKPYDDAALARVARNALTAGTAAKADAANQRQDELDA